MGFGIIYNKNFEKYEKLFYFFKKIINFFYFIVILFILKLLYIWFLI